MLRGKLPAMDKPSMFAMHRIGTLVALAMFLTAASFSVRPVTARDVGDWQSTGLTVPTGMLFGPTSGALLAVQPASGPSYPTPGPATLWRSDDAGGRWSSVALPDGAYLVAVDPTSHELIYAVAPTGIYKTEDGGQTWIEKVPDSYFNPYARPAHPVIGNWERGLTMTVSRADHRLVYLSLRKLPYNGLFVRTEDGGETWLAGPVQFDGPSCGIQAQALLASATERGRLLSSQGCSRLLRGSGVIRVSIDFGESWTSAPLAEQRDPAQSQWISPVSVDGWHADAPSRLYVLAERFNIVNLGTGETVLLGSALFRTDNDGQEYRELLTLPLHADRSGARLRALTTDPARSDTVYLARDGGVRVSRDGGESWVALGRQDLPPITYLLVGIDGRNLFASTEQGVYRLPLSTS
jgi:photosystem II stability/assembly factor-like uncharacterized protein